MLRSLQNRADESPAEDDPGPPDILAWANEYRRIDGQRFDLSRFEPLRHIYQHLAADDHANVAIIKPAQRGVSELAVNLACFALDRGASVWTNGAKLGLNVGYVFPTDDALSDFSKERISGLRGETDYLGRMFRARGSYDAVGFKQIRDSYLYLRGAKSEAGLKSFAADLLVLDEFDEMSPAAVALARIRLNASVIKRELDLSTPTVPGMGIHERWLQSDRNIYIQRCEMCDAEVQPRFFADVWADGVDWTEWQYWTPQRIRMSDVGVHCPNCRRIWSFAQRTAPGFWRAEQPSIKSLRGYWIPALPWAQADLTELAVKAIAGDEADKREFARSDLGEPYESSDARVTEDMLLSLDAELPNGRLGDWNHYDVTMGVDVGSRLHYRISGMATDGKVDVLKMGAVRSWEELSSILVTYKVRQCVVDALPEQHAAAAWQAKHKGRVLTAFYPNRVLGLFAFKDAETPQRQDRRNRPGARPPRPGVIYINRSRAMDAVHASIAQHRERWPTVYIRDPEVMAHMISPARVVGTDKQGQEQIDWVHTRPDHYFHAVVYDQVARAALPTSPQGALLASGARTQMAH